MNKPRAKLKRAYLDVDFLNHPKVRGMARIFGRLSQLCLIDIYLQMSKATNALIDKDVLLSVVEDFDIEDPEQFIAYCLGKGLIESAGGSNYTNSVVVKDQESYAKKLKVKPGSEADESDDYGNESDFSGKKSEISGNSPGKNPGKSGNETRFTVFTFVLNDAFGGFISRTG